MRAFTFQRAVVDEHAYELANEERVALARRQHAADDPRRQLRGADDARREARRGAGLEAPERDHIRDEAALCRERRARVAQLRARGDEHEQRNAGAPLDQVFEQVEQQRLRPLRVVDREHDRLRGRDRGEEPAEHEERFLGRRGRTSEQGCDPRRDAVALGLAFGHDRLDRGAHRLRAGNGVEREQGPKRVGDGGEGRDRRGVAMGGHDDRAVAEPPRQLCEEARLAESRRAENRRQTGGRRRDRGVMDGA
ncbi:MAG: hypothetical protein E6J72_13625 [Deltaproteobacteria bacterium]|nr:MAG: hypothetical protein E6J72_13625 [Deltaproteobacteria bacterium]